MLSPSAGVLLTVIEIGDSLSDLADFVPHATQQAPSQGLSGLAAVVQS